MTDWAQLLTKCSLIFSFNYQRALVSLGCRSPMAAGAARPGAARPGPSGPARRSAATGAVMWQRIQICCTLFALCSAAPPAHINRLALFPDKSAWCEAKNITQIVGHTGCQPRSIQNRACLGQCFSYSVPNTFPQSTESLVHCDSCMPAQTQWEVVTLDCPGNEESPHVDKLVERIFHCSCQSCSKEGAQEGAVMQLYPADSVQDTPSLSDTLSGAQTHPLSPPGSHSNKHAHAHTHTDHHTLPHTSGGG